MPKRVIVIGLGIFGSNVVKTLFDAGIEVIAVDKNKEVVKQVKDYSIKAIVADGTDKALFDVLGIQQDDIVIVSFGENLAASTLITLYLSKLKVKNIIVKTPNEEHKMVLERVGATEVIIPEKEVAIKVAKSIISPNLLDYVPLGEDYVVGEIAPPKFLIIGKSVEEVALRSKYHVNVIPIRDTLEDKVTMLIPGYKIKSSDILVVIGKEKDISQLEKKSQVKANSKALRLPLSHT